MVTTSYPRSGDGSEAAGAFVADLAAYLSRDIQMRVAAPGDRQTVDRDASGIEVFRYATAGRPLSTLSPLRPSDAIEIVRTLARGQRAVDRALADGKMTHVLALWALPSGHWARRAARRHGLGYSVWTLGSDIWSLGRLPGVRQFLRGVLRDARYCYSDGLQLARDTESIGGREATFLPSARAGGGQRAEPVRPASPYRLLFLGRWHANKGVDLLLDALALLGPADWARISQIRIAGGGPLNFQVSAAIQALQARGHPVWEDGYLDAAAAQEALASADIVLIPSRIESIPLVFSDALKAGCPVVAMPVGDLTDLVSERGVGWVADDVSATSFAAALRRALEGDPSGRKEAVAELAREFSLEQVAKRLMGDLGPVS
ncbi:MAG: hypothetical protein CL625_00430 [Arenimonas sp.]|nr:hypothetical protein [Arenimonas sp.]